MTEFENKRVFREQVRAEIRTVVGNYHEKSAFGAMEDAIVALLTSHARPAAGHMRDEKGNDYSIFFEYEPTPLDPSRTVVLQPTPAAAQAERGEG